MDKCPLPSLHVRTQTHFHFKHFFPFSTYPLCTFSCSFPNMQTPEWHLACLGKKMARYVCRSPVFLNVSSFVCTRSVCWPICCSQLLQWFGTGNGLVVSNVQYWLLVQLSLVYGRTCLVKWPVLCLPNWLDGAYSQNQGKNAIGYLSLFFKWLEIHQSTFLYFIHMSIDCEEVAVVRPYYNFHLWTVLNGYVF